MPSDDLLDLCVRVREHTGRTTTPADRLRIEQRIAGLPVTEQTAQKKMLNRMLGIAPTQPNRDRP